MKKSIAKLLFALVIPVTFSLVSCSKDDDDNATPVTPVNNNPNPVTPENSFTINGGPFTNAKFDYSTASLIRAWNYTSDSTILYFNKSNTDYVSLLLRGNNTGNYSFTGSNQLQMIFQHNGAYYTISSDIAGTTGSAAVTTYGAVGGRVKGTITFTGTLTDALTSTTYPVTLNGKFDLLRAH